VKIIAHRANLNGPKPYDENNPLIVDKVIEMGLDVEIDLRCYNNQYYLGHDNPDYAISKQWLEDRSEFLWVHCKNEESIMNLNNTKNINYFWHQNDDYTITSHGFVWVYPNKKIFKNSICVLPELGINGIIEDCYAICTDYPERYLNV